MSQSINYPGGSGKRFSFSDFITDSRSIGIVLLLCTAASLVITNIPGIGAAYESFWDRSIPFLGKLNLPHSPLEIINDLLMVLFFFSVGMEIKREAVVGELSSPSRMTLPLVAALFGVAVPALIFFFITKGTPYTHGWAIPTATDIAFSLGILSLLGKAVPHSVKIFLTALAIIDDLSAILIIALFYGDSPNFKWLLGVAVCVIVIILLVKYMRNGFGRLLYFFLGLAMWYFMFRSGIHATFAGVLLSILLPVKTIEDYEKKLYIPVNFMIIPLFALANTSIVVNATAMSHLLTELSLGIIFGLLIGKPVGITLAVFLMVKARVIKLPSKTNFKIFTGVGILAGIGFTMSIFVSMLAFNDKMMQDTAKLAVLLASILSMIIGFLWLKAATKKIEPDQLESPEEIAK